MLDLIGRWSLSIKLYMISENEHHEEVLMTLKIGEVFELGEFAKNHKYSLKNL